LCKKFSVYTGLQKCEVKKPHLGSVEPCGPISDSHGNI